MVYAKTAKVSKLREKNRKGYPLKRSSNIQQDVNKSGRLGLGGCVFRVKVMCCKACNAIYCVILSSMCVYVYLCLRLFIFSCYLLETQ